MPGSSFPSTADPAVAIETSAPVDEVLVTDTGAPAAARALVTGVAQRSLRPDRLADLLVVVSEAVTNAALHAYPPDRPGAVRVKAWAQPGAVAVLVRDEGCGFDPASTFRGVRSGLGMGVGLMRAVASELTIASWPGAGTVVLVTVRD